MNVILEKNGEQIDYGNGAAIYLLLQFIPIVGGIISLIFMIMKKQFRGIWLNQFIWGLIATVLYIIMFTGAVMESNAIIIISFIAILALLILFVVMYVMYVLNANYYSIKQRLAEGYVVLNGDDPMVALAVSKAEAIKKPFWQFTRF